MTTGTAGSSIVMVEVGLRGGGIVSSGAIVGARCCSTTTVLHTSAHGGFQQKATAEQLTLAVLAGGVENVTSSPVDAGLKGHGSEPVVATE